MNKKTQFYIKDIITVVCGCLHQIKCNREVADGLIVHFKIQLTKVLLQILHSCGERDVF